MSEAVENQVNEKQSNTLMAKVSYILFMLGAVLPLTGIIGLVISYIYKGDAPEWLKSHYQYLIRTFWIGALYVVSGLLLTLAIVGYLILLFWFIWLIVRCVKGLKALSAQEPISNVKSWLF